MTFRYAEHTDPELRTALGYARAADLLDDGRGRTVRCTPARRTVEMRGLRGAPGGSLFRKEWSGGGAWREWDGLAWLESHGFRGPRRVCIGADRSRSAILIGAVAGRPLDVVLQAGLRGQDRYLVDQVAPMVRRLHRLGRCHRDLYSNHLFVSDLSAEPAVIDVERLFAPRWRRRRWWIKDLAALWSSMPAGTPACAGLRFLRAYLGPERWGRAGRTWARAIAARTARIEAHRPKYG